MRSATDLATRISRALISYSNNLSPTRTWNPSLEQTLHRLGCRDSLTPSLVAQVIDPHLLNQHSLALGFFNWAAQQPGFLHESVSYESILKSLSLSRQFSAIDALLKQARAQKITLNSSAYRVVISSLVLGQKTQNAFSVFKEASSLSREIGTDVCNSLLAALASDGQFNSAQKMFDEMTERGISFTTLGICVFMWRSCGKSLTCQILCMLDKVKKLDSDINGSILAVLVVHGLCQASRESEAFWLLDELRSRDCKPDFMAYGIVANEFRSKGNVYEREMVLKKKRKLGVAPRSSDYREFILALISNRLIREAKELGEIIVSGNFPIEDDVLNALIGSVSAVDASSATMFLNFMIRKDQFPTLLTLSNLSRNLCKHGKAEELLKVYTALSCNDYFTDMESYKIMVFFLCKAGRVREAYGILNEMKKKGIEPDVSLYNSFMEACCREVLLRPAKRLWDEMFANGCRANLKTYNILIRKLSEEGEVEDCLRLFHHMLDKGVAPDNMTYSSLFVGLCKETKVEAGFEVFNKAIEQDPVLAQSISSTFVLQLCRNGHFLSASKLLYNLPADIVSSHSHVILLKCLADAKLIEMGIKHLKQIEETSPSMAEAISSELSASLSSSLTPEPILNMLRAL
ncbi:pentatricopeptide repeat-containing protein At5g14080, partial [Carica papaya]|uniref:pentatricopeptide repeat-containing protein At5g14080 n=1 Tax=Carica papaya TaxID=3649 RepID=UPI000B8C812A